AGAAEMLTGQIAPLPDDFAALGIEAGRAVATEMDVDASRFDRRRARGIAVQGIAQRKDLLVVPEVNIVEYFARVLIDADRVVLRPVFRRGRDPNLIAPDHRTAPAFVVQRRLPLDILG